MTTIPLDYLPDSRSLMERLYLHPYPAFLDSSGAATGRYDILSAAPVAWHDITEPTALPEVLGLMRNLVRDNLGDVPPAEADGRSLPFLGGLLGYLGYPHLEDRDRIVLDEGFVGVYLWAVVVDHVNATSELVFHPRCPAPERERVRTWIQDEATATTAPDFALDTPFAAAASREAYAANFRRVQDYIADGDCYQINLTQQYAASCRGDPFAAYCQLRATSAAPFSAFIRCPDRALLSVSPERFLQHRDGRVSTQPIKGTRPRDADPKRDQALAAELQDSTKDRAENLMIVDLLRNDLGRVCTPGSVRADRLFELQSFEAVHHLVSTVSGELAPGKDVYDLIASCFPGGSITGAPKLRAMAIIAELESHARRLYCGSVFRLSANGDFDSSITIRSLLWQADELHCWAGGGIVMDSRWEAEYQECTDKIATIIRTLESRD